MPHFSDHPDGLVFSIHIQPRASTNRVVGAYGDALKIRLTAPPVDGAANKMCIRFLAKILGVKRSQLEILSGHTGRHKRLLLKCAETYSKKGRNHYRNRLESLWSGEKTA